MADCRSNNHEIMRMLLSSPNPPPKIKIDPPRSMEKQNNDSDYDCEMRLYPYLEQLSGKPEELNVVEMDHTYSLPWHARPDNSFAKPAKLLFVSKGQKFACRVSSDSLDPVEVTPHPRPAYDAAKAKLLMEDTSRIVSILRSDPGDPDWEQKIDRTDWSSSQNKLFERVHRIMHSEQLSRLAHQGNWNEAVQRRVSLDKATKRFRTLMSAVSWKPKLTHWLHNFLLENLESSYLIIYMDILQTLYKKVPTLVERILSAQVGPKINPDALKLLTKKSWDPASTGLNNYKPKRLPGNPLIVIIPYGCSGGSDGTPRVMRWLPYLSQIGIVVPVNTNSSSKITVVTSLEHMLSATRAKLAELRSDFGDKPVVLLGLGSGSALAVQVALVEQQQVSAIACLGFPVNTVEDKRGQADDNIYNLNTPTLFVIGQHAASSYVDDVEDIREKLKVHTGLVVVGSADDNLRIAKAKQKAEGLTQSMLDRCIVDEIADFVGNILSAPKPSPHQPALRDDGGGGGLLETQRVYKFVERKRRASGQDDAFPRRPYNTANRRGLGRGGRGRGRPRVVNSVLDSGGIGIQPISRRTVADKPVLRPSIDNISIINSTNMDILEGDEFSAMETGDNIPIDQLTPDSLLEMPVIIAPAGQGESHDSQIKVVMDGGGDKGDGEGGGDIEKDGGEKLTLNRAGPGHECATIYFRRRGTGFTRLSPPPVVNNRQVKRPRILSASEYAVNKRA